MPNKLLRYTQKLFGVNAASEQIGEYGSYAAGAIAYPAADGNGYLRPDEIQSLSQYLSGWFAATVGLNYPAMNDRNALDYLFAYQLCQIFQSGMPEYDSGTNYFLGSFVTNPSTGLIYVSTQNNNSGNALTNLNYWQPYKGNAGFNPQASQTLATRAVAVWTAETIAEANPWNAVAWSPEQTLFAAVASSGTHQVMTSPDGKAWTAYTAADSDTWTSICWSPELNVFCAIGAEYSEIFTTGASITGGTNSSTEEWSSVCWSPVLGMFVACAETGGAGTHQFQYSTNGTTWTGVAVAGGESWSSVCWSETLNLFVAVAYAGTNRVATSVTGTSWTLGTAAAAKEWISVKWSPQLGLFAAVSFDGFIMTSPDGLVWTSQAPPTSANPWSSISWSPQLGMFVAVSQSSAMMYSFDGVNWSATTAAHNIQWNGIVWSPQLGIFSSVANTGTTTARGMISKYVQRFAS